MSHRASVPVNREPKLKTGREQKTKINKLLVGGGS